MELLISLILGILPEALYYYLYIKNIKEIKTKKLILFVSIFIIHVLSMFLLRHNFYMYILYDIALYLLIKVMFKSKINDFFLIIFLEVYYYLISCICFFLINNYILAFIINRILMFMPLLFKNKLIKLYRDYKMMWNRNDNKNYPIKSLTLRNISLITTNILIILAYITLLYLSR